MNNVEEFNDNLFFVFEKLLMDKELAEKFAECKTEDELYNFCLKIKGGYTKEEWEKFAEIIYKLTINKENDKILLDNDLEEIGGGSMTNNIGKKALSGTLAALTAATVLQVGSVGASAASSSPKPKTSVSQRSSTNEGGLLKNILIKLGFAVTAIFNGFCLYKLITFGKDSESSEDLELSQTQNEVKDKASKSDSKSSEDKTLSQSSGEEKEKLNSENSIVLLTRGRSKSVPVEISKNESLEKLNSKNLEDKTSDQSSGKKEKTSTPADLKDTRSEDKTLNSAVVVPEVQPSVQIPDDREGEVSNPEQAAHAGSEDKTSEDQKPEDAKSEEKTPNSNSAVPSIRKRSKSVSESGIVHGVKNPRYLCCLISVVQQLISDRGMLGLILKDDVKNHFKREKEFNAFREMVNMALRCRGGYEMTKEDAESLEKLLREAGIYDETQPDASECLHKILEDLYPEYLLCLVSPLKIADSTDVQELVEHGGKMNIPRAREILEQEQHVFVENFRKCLEKNGVSKEEIDESLNVYFDRLSRRGELCSRKPLRMFAKGESDDDGFYLSAGNRVYFPINRTSWSGDASSKVFTPIRVPEILKLDGREYRFVGSILHGGDAIDRGHYTSIVSYDGNVFYLFDDDRPVKQLSKEDALKQSGEWGAILIYQLI